jgi:hypothetical protein
MFSQKTNKRFLLAGIASTMVILTLAPVAMASDDYNNRDNGHNNGIVPPYLRDRDSRNERETGRNSGIVPPYMQDKVEANRSKGW